jgi:hypothetical protein
VDGLRDKFSVTWRFFTLGNPETLAATQPELFEREKKRLVDMFEETRNAGVALLRTRIGELVDHLVTQLTPSADGKRKRFYTSNVKNIQSFLDTFDMRDIGDDKELRGLLDKIQGLLNGVDPEAIRASENFREQTRESFREIQTTLDGMIEAAPARRIDARGFGIQNSEEAGSAS